MLVDLPDTRPANDDDPDIAVRAGLDVLKEKLRLEAGGRPPTTTNGYRAALVWMAARAIICLEAYDRRDAEMKFEGIP